MTRIKIHENKIVILSITVALITLLLLPLAGCNTAAGFCVIEKSYSDDPSKISIGIVNKNNLVSSSGTGSIAENKQMILEIIDEAKEYGVNMLLFPEFSLTGYFWGDPESGAGIEECWGYMREGVTNNHLEWLGQVKSKLDDQLQYIIFNNIRLDPDDSQGKFFNSTYVVDANFDCDNLNSESNEQLHIYDKTFLPGIEKTFTKSGETDTLVLDTEWGKFGFTTCYDMCFTQIFQEYAMIDKVDGFIELASWRGSSDRDYPGMGVKQDHYYGFIWDSMISTQASFNQAWVIGCNAVGDQERSGYDYEFWGGSGLWAPSGVKLLEGSNDKEELIVIHNVDIEGQVQAEHDDFYYYDDFIQIYDLLANLRTYTRMEN